MCLELYRAGAGSDGFINQSAGIMQVLFYAPFIFGLDKIFTNLGNY
jgi:hypothetical protein